MVLEMDGLEYFKALANTLVSLTEKDFLKVQQ